MPVLRVIAAADMTALQTQPKMNPAVAAGETLLAALGRVWHMVASFEQVLADGGFDAHVLRYISNSSVMRVTAVRRPAPLVPLEPPRRGGVVESRPMPTTAGISVSDQLRKIPPSIRPTFQAARRTVKAVAPTAKEIAYQSQPPRSSRSMWKIVRYAVDDANVVAIGTFPSYASLFFYRGRELDDGSGLLEGGGKQLRFLRLRAPADATRPAVKRLVRKAFTLGGRTTRT